MPEQAIFDDLATFFDDIPDAVRIEISLLLFVLTDDHAVETDDCFDYERTARGLFNGQDRFGRLGELIKAVGIFDAYFAADPRQRSTPAVASSGQRHRNGAAHQPDALRNRYAGRIAAIEQARQDWQILRQTTLTSAAISGALMPQIVSGSKSARVSSFRSEHQVRVNQRIGP